MQNTLTGFVQNERDTLASAGILTQPFTLTNAQIVSLYSAPTLVIPAPPNGSLIEVVGYTLENINGGTAYLLGGSINLFYGASASPPLYAGATAIAAGFMTGPVVTQIIRANGANGTASTGNPSSDVIGVGLYIGCLTQNFSQVGNAGTILGLITYRITTGW